MQLWAKNRPVLVNVSNWEACCIVRNKASRDMVSTVIRIQSGKHRTMTPKLSDNDEERKALLSCILKFRCPGICWMIRSTQMIEAPAMHAMSKSAGMYRGRSSSQPPTYATEGSHDPSSCVVVHGCLFDGDYLVRMGDGGWGRCQCALQRCMHPKMRRCSG